MAEFALVVGVIFLPLMFGVLEFGRASWVKTTVTAAAREGVRYAIVHGNTVSASKATQVTVSDYVKARTQLSPIGVATIWKPAGREAPGDTVQVQVTYSYVPIIRIIPARTIKSTSWQVIAF